MIDMVTVTNDLDDSYCGPLYVKNATLSASVVAAIVSGTQSAQGKIAAATATSSGTPISQGINATVVGTGGFGAASPTAFTGVAGKMQSYGLIVATVVVTSAMTVTCWLS